MRWERRVREKLKLMAGRGLTRCLVSPQGGSKEGFSTLQTWSKTTSGMRTKRLRRACHHLRSPLRAAHNPPPPATRTSPRGRGVERHVAHDQVARRPVTWRPGDGVGRHVLWAATESVQPAVLRQNQPGMVEAVSDCDDLLSAISLVGVYGRGGVVREGGEGEGIGRWWGGRGASWWRDWSRERTRGWWDEAKSL